MPKAKTGNFTLRKIAQNVPATLAAHRFADLQRSGQFSELRFVQRGKSAFDIVGYRWPDKGVRRRLNIGRARQNPSMTAGPTPNQVTFGARGKTKVGWINQETPTRYQITYKDGRQTKTVWRAKNKVRFMAGKRSSRKNPCPKTANPGSRALSQALDLSRRFHGAAPRKVREINFRAPESLVSIGQCAQLDYVSDKFDGKRRRYFHEFEKPCTVLADPQRQADGQSLIVLLGNFKITERGIIG